MVKDGKEGGGLQGLQRNNVGYLMGKPLTPTQCHIKTTEITLLHDK